MDSYKSIASVVIGRNEGERLKLCLQSLIRQADQVVYVDSGSTDGSVDFAKSLAVGVVELDLSTPFTAARARNEGTRFLLEKYPEIEFIQFVDGDCEVQARWIAIAVEFLEQNEDYAVVGGRRRERFPHVSIYNQLCDIEWDTSIGDAKACGGDALIRITALNGVNGYRNDLIAGEEPEMCFRMRQQGWKIRRLDAEMTLHDAAITKVTQWWKRQKRAGHAYAESFYLHGRSDEAFRKKECKSILLWGAVLPLLIILPSLFYPVMLVLFAIYPLQILRLSVIYHKRFNAYQPAILYATFNVAAKWPQFSGLASFHINRLRGQRNKIIEYK